MSSNGHQDSDEESLAKLMKQRKKNLKANLESQLTKHAQTVDGALHAIEVALETLNTHFETYTKSSIRSNLAKIDEGLRGLQATVAKKAAKHATPAPKPPPKVDEHSKKNPLKIIIKRPKVSAAAVKSEQPSPSISSAKESTIPLPISMVPNDEGYVIYDMSMIPVPPIQLNNIALHLGNTPDAFCDGILWPVLVFANFADAKAWAMDTTLLELLHPTLDESDRVVFYFGRANTLQDLRQLAVVPMADLGLAPWSLDACSASTDSLYQLAMQQAAQFQAAICPLQAHEWLLQCSLEASSYEFWEPEKLASAASEISTNLNEPKFTDYQLLLYAFWPTLEASGWKCVPNSTNDIVGYAHVGVTFTSRKAVVLEAIKDLHANELHSIVWRYMLKANYANGAHGGYDVAGRTFGTMAEAVQAFFAERQKSKKPSKTTSASSIATVPEVTFDQIYREMLQDGWYETSDSYGNLFCKPSYRTAVTPELGKDFFRSLADVELYVTLQDQPLWDRMVKKLQAQEPNYQQNAPKQSSKRAKVSSSKKRKADSSTTFDKVFAYLQTKGWFRHDDGRYFKPKANVDTATEGIDKFSSPELLEAYLKSSGTWYKVKAVVDANPDHGRRDRSSPKPKREAKVKREPKPPPAPVASTAAPAASTAAPTTKKSRAMAKTTMAAVPEFQPTFSKVYRELQREGWFHKSGQFGWSYYKPGVNVKEAVLEEDWFSNEVQLELYLKTSGEWQRIVDQKNKELQELYGYYQPSATAPVAGAAPIAEPVSMLPPN
ncbi:hypothetical protein LEN26_008011 [Aphanomyces euteiches]|nr:hypothetical protein LEN26_008011 [Aphanomyces euteiches]